MIGETSKLTLIIPPKRVPKAQTCAIALQHLVGRTSHEFISITEIFGYSLVPCILLMFSPVFPKCSNAQYRDPGAQLRSCIALSPEVDMHDTKERLSLFWIFALLNYLYADVVALFAIVDSPNLADAPHLPPWALLGSAVLMEIPIAMIVACRLLPFRANRLSNIIAGTILTLVNGFLTFVPPLVGARTPALPEYLFFATIETVCTSVIVWKAWTWSPKNAEPSTS